MPTKEELYNLYIVQNKYRCELATIFNVSITTIKRWLKKYKIKKSIKKVTENIQKTFISKYGVKNYSMTDEGRNKISIKMSNKSDIERQVTLKKYKQTCLRKYGTENIQKLPEINKKKEITATKNHGGVGFASKELNEKIKTIIIKKYGVDNCSKSEEIKNKKIESKRIHKTFTNSKEEEYIYQKLLEKFTEVKRQYTSEKYPFACDFYIVQLDLYIEYQGMWSHGKYNNKKIYGPYDKNNLKHQEILNKWQEKANTGSKNYEQAIDVWTKRDPLKRETAKKNNLNWIEFFSLNEFIEWFNMI